MAQQARPFWHKQRGIVNAELSNFETKSRAEHEITIRHRHRSAMVDGKPASVKDLRKGMKVSATRIVEEPTTEMSEETTVTG